jgi:hypothetical protein
MGESNNVGCISMSRLARLTDEFLSKKDGESRGDRGYRLNYGKLRFMAYNRPILAIPEFQAILVFSNLTY